MFNEWYIKHSGRYHHTRSELGFFLNSSEMRSCKRGGEVHHQSQECHET